MSPRFGGGACEAANQGTGAFCDGHSCTVEIKHKPGGNHLSSLEHACVRGMRFKLYVTGTVKLTAVLGLCAAGPGHWQANIHANMKVHYTAHLKRIVTHPSLLHSNIDE